LLLLLKFVFFYFYLAGTEARWPPPLMRQ
jgi:hypothetical protein